MAVLEKFNINSKDVQVKILEKWLDDSSTQIANFLDSHGISTKNAPSIWDEQFVYCVLGQHGSARGYDGIQYGERIFLRKACHALGLEYEDLGIISKGKYSTGDKRLAALHVPKGLKFDPGRHVAPVNVCAVCNDLIERNAYVSDRAVTCHQCYQGLYRDDKNYYGFGFDTDCQSLEGAYQSLEVEIQERIQVLKEAQKRRGWP